MRNHPAPIRRGYLYILKCSNGSYYTGSTIDLKKRLAQHQNGEGSNHTRKFLPVELVYYEIFSQVEFAFIREKQIQRWSRAKKEALIEGRLGDLVLLSKSKNPESNESLNGIVSVHRKLTD